MWPKALTDRDDQELQLSDDLVATAPTADAPEAVIEPESLVVYQQDANTDPDALPVYEDATGGYVVPSGRLFVQSEQDSTALEEHLRPLGLEIDSVLSFDKGACYVTSPGDPSAVASLKADVEELDGVRSAELELLRPRMLK